jgi:uncharacterized repeat protein (TIGR03803 family)
LLSTVVVTLILTVIGVSMTHAQTLQVLHAFIGKDGSSPSGDLIRDSAGNLYGTTQSGLGSALYGLVFKLDPSGNETVLYKFTGRTDGGDPFGRLYRDKKGNLYGTTLEGGDPGCYCGTVYKLATNGTFTILHTFVGGSDGRQNFGQPGGGLLAFGSELYGATYFGGIAGCDGNLGCGTIFKVSVAGVETVLYRFSGQSDGAFPRDLIADATGNLYGVTESSYDSAAANGGIFKLDTNGQLTTLYNFSGGTNGSYPYWRLTTGINGVVYGTTTSGGSVNCSVASCGTAFSFDTTTGVQTVLHSFNAQPGDGSEPSGGLLNANGNLIGAAAFGGNTYACLSGCGAIYGIGSAGTYTLLHRFTGGADGAGPVGALTADSKGNLYGAASYGGLNDNGVIFKITP